jgi:hypothetical protein
MKVKIKEVLLDKIADGSSPEEIHFQHHAMLSFDVSWCG